MPWNLIPPRQEKTPFWYVRGTYCGIRLYRSTGTGDRDAAKRIFATWKRQAETGQFYKPEPDATPQPRTFVTAASAYMRSGGDGTYMPLILAAWKTRELDDIDQIAIDTLAAELYPSHSAATRNRQVYTPVAAVLHRAGVKIEIARPKGWKGKKSTSWLELHQAFALFEAADQIDAEFGLLCRFLLYTGMRINEALGIELRHVALDRGYVYLPDSKNGEPRGCHLPPVLVEAIQAQPARAQKPITRNKVGHYLSGGRSITDAGVPFLQRQPQTRFFRYHQGGALRDMLADAMKAAGLVFPRRQGGFHIFCHTYGSWMHRYGELDTYGLTRTGRWADAQSADRYVHTQASEEARRADLLPTPPKRGAVVALKSKAG